MTERIVYIGVDDTDTSIAGWDEWHEVTQIEILGLGRSRESAATIIHDQIATLHNSSKGLHSKPVTRRFYKPAIDTCSGFSFRSDPGCAYVRR
jgi:hypothetical protein